MLQPDNTEQKNVRKTIRVIGLTGGIASGKSSVARLLEERGLPVIDADELSRESVRPGSSCLASIVAEFGREVLLADGTLDRKRLGTLIFSDPQKRKTLEQLVHPEIRRLAEAGISAVAAAGKDVVFYMAPLLIEAGAMNLVDEIWVVTVDQEVQLARLMSRDNVSREQAEKMVAAQMPLEEKKCFGRIVIDNSGTSDDLLYKLSVILDNEKVS